VKLLVSCKYNPPYKKLPVRVSCAFTQCFFLMCLWDSPAVLAASLLAQTPSIAIQPILALYDVQINQASSGEARFLKDTNGLLYVHEADFISWRLRRPEAAGLKYDGQTWLLMNGMPGVSYKINESKQTIQIEASAQSFLPSSVSAERNAYVQPTVPNWGSFANYDLLGTGTKDVQQLNGVFNVNVFGPYGTFSSSYVGQNLWSQTQQARHMIRQETVWSRDWPEQMVNVQVGDTQGRGGLWGRPVYFGGMRWGRNFATQPGFVTTPTPVLAGEAVLPSTVDLYIDGVARKHLNVPSGPFSLNDFPQVTGQGEAKLIVRDSLGREQVIVAPYGATGALLKQGVVDYSVDAGFIRKNLGLNSGDYGNFMTAVTLRKGWSERLTVEGRGESTRGQQSVGLGGSVLTTLGIATAALVTSHSAAGAGTLRMLSLDKQTLNVNFGLRGQISSANFVQIGGFTAAGSVARTFSANLGWQLSGGHALGASYTQRAISNQPINKIASLNYSTQFKTGLSLNASLLATLSEPKSTSLMFFLVKPFNDKGGTTMLSGNVRNRHIEQPTLQLQQATWRNGDLGYRALLAGGTDQRQEAGLTLRSEHAIYTADASHVQAATNYRVGMQGGIAVLDGGAYATQRINDSFALVHVPGYPNLNVSSNYQVVASTNSKGDALLPDLSSYRINTVGIDTLALPMDAQLANSQKTFVPYSRSGLSATFAIKRSRSAVLTLMLDDGKPAPVGMNVSVEGVAETFMVGMRGEVFATDLSEHNKIQAEWHGKTCQFNYSILVNTNEMVYSEPIVCRGVQR
jgi:outer membrane usher protein